MFWHTPCSVRCMADSNRITRLERRLARLQQRLANIPRWNGAWRARFQAMIDEVLVGDPGASDTEIARAISRRLDDKIDLPGVWDTALDIGVTALAWVAVTIIRNRKELLRRRITRIEKILARLRSE